MVFNYLNAYFQGQMVNINCTHRGFYFGTSPGLREWKVILTDIL